MNKALLIVLSLSLIATNGCGFIGPKTRPLKIAKVESMQDFETDAWVYGRDAGNSIRMGSDVLWVFGDTFGWSGLHCATAAWSNAARPWSLDEPVDNWFNAHQFYTFSPGELQFNADHETPPDCCKQHQKCAADNAYCHCPKDTDCGTRIAIWPGDLIETGSGTALHYYEKVWVGSAPYDFEHLGTGIADVQYKSTRAHRPPGDDGEPLLIFRPDEPNYLRAIRVAEDSGPYIYLYASANRRECKVDVLAARVPLVAAFERGAYEFWNGNGWTGDIAGTVPILASVVGGLGSVTWSEHLGHYVSAFNDICSGGTHLLVRTAPRPEGPWSEPTAIDLRPLGATKDAYAGQIHGSLSDGRNIVFTFYQPQELGVGRVRLGRIVLE